MRRDAGSVTAAALREFLAERVAKWWLPDEIAFLDALPHTATGKVSKLTLRENFAGHKLPGT